jgi:hypothetical protein
MKLSHAFLLGPALSLAAFVSPLSAAAIVTGTLSNTLPNVGDLSASPVNIGFSINFLGTTYSTLSVNENGNVTFANAGGDSDYGLPSLTEAGFPVIAPFFADVDTTGAGSSQITYGNLTVNGQQAFAVDYVNVGYFPSASDKLNSFQFLLIQGTTPGNFTIEFNYDKIQWESGLASGGIGGLGGGSAVVGFSGTGTSSGFTYQLPGSAVDGALIDGGPNSLVANSLNSRGGVAGRYDFNFVNGALVTTPEPATVGLTAAGMALLLAGMGRLKSHQRS